MNSRGEPGAGCTLEEARAAKQAALGVFGRLTNVAGIGITRSGAGYGLKVNLSRLPPAGVSVPKDVQGVPVRIEVIGPVTKRLVSGNAAK